VTNLWLGIEYNANHKDVDTMEVLMKEYLKCGSVRVNSQFFERLKAQVAVFGNPESFYYDDVSIVKATGKQSEEEQYYLNVIKSIDHHVCRFKKLKPSLILIGGGLAFDAYCKYILPNLTYNSLTIVQLRNPSKQAHWGNPKVWNEKYDNFRPSLPCREGLSLLKLTCSDIDSDFVLSPS